MNDIPISIFFETIFRAMLSCDVMSNRKKLFSNEKKSNEKNEKILCVLLLFIAFYIKKNVTQVIFQSCYFLFCFISFYFIKSNL